MAKWRKSSAGLLTKFSLALSEFEGVEQRKMFGCPCGFVNGHIFTSLHEDHWIVRLSEEDREIIQAEPFAPMGRAMREYIKLPKGVVDDPEELDAWLNRAYAFASSLPPKIKD